MPKQVTLLSAFVASPSDMFDERSRLEEIITELNITWGNTIGLRIELLKWETHSHPSMDTEAQAVINRQIPDYDIFIGLMGRKFGKPTREFGSGTEEEFERAREKHAANPYGTEIMMYFREEAFSPTLSDLDEFRKVLEFKEKISKYGALYSKFDTLENFEKLLRLHLSKKVQTWNERPKSETIIIDGAGHSPNNDEDDGDIGLLDALEAVEDHVASMAASTEAMSLAIGELGQRMNQRTEELSKIPRDTSGAVDRRLAKRVISASARDFESFSESTEANLPVYKKAFERSINALVVATELGVDFGSEENFEEQRKAVREQVSQLFGVLQGARESSLGFRNAMAALPRIASDFNRARRSALASLDAIIAEFDSNLNILGEVDF